ncbi:MAG: FAD-binding protein [Actinomycetota bacterium]|nr:FAD-binding protein [Actinomycetota bacterium]
MSSIGTNWSGNVIYSARALHRPRTVSELQTLVAERDRIRALGSRHSFSSIADSAELISLADLEGEITVDVAAGTVTAPAGVTYAELAVALDHRGLALANLASLPHISVAGAVATGTHGSGDRAGSLATSVVGIELVTADGALLRSLRGEPEFPGLVVGLGALGIVTQLTLAAEPTYTVAQRVYEGLGWDVLLANLDAITAAGDSVSVFHRAGPATEQVWVKRRLPSDPLPAELFGSRSALEPRNPVLGANPANATEQLGVAGPWSERLPHFRSGFTPSSGAEIQSELLVGRAHAAEAIAAMRGLSAQIRPLMLVGELRTVAADELWLSPAYQRDTLALHFTWRREPKAVQAAIAALEAVLAPCDARPHWGKAMAARAVTLAPLYPRMADFRRLRSRLDPRGVFVNQWLIDHVLGEGPEPSGR